MCVDEVFRGQEQGTAASGRSVSAADVVLFGVNIVLPLMSQDLLKVRPNSKCKSKQNVRMTLLHSHRFQRRFFWSSLLCVDLLSMLQFPSLCNQYYKLITFICEIFPEKIPQLPEELFKSLMFSLELGMTAYPFFFGGWG